MRYLPGEARGETG